MWFLHPSAFVPLKRADIKWYSGAKWSLQQPGPSVEHLHWMKMLLQRQQFWRYRQLQKLLKLTLKGCWAKCRNLERNIFRLLHEAPIIPRFLFFAVWELSFSFSEEELANILYTTLWSILFYWGDLFTLMDSLHRKPQPSWVTITCCIVVSTENNNMRDCSSI